MKRVALLFSLMLGLALVGCGGEINLDNVPGGGGPGGGTTDCPPEKIKCYGDIDDGTTICTCDDLWDCSKNPNKCDTDRPAPPGGNGWNCAWVNEDKYICTRKGGKGTPPGGGTDWYCTWDDQAGQWKCVRIKTPQPPGGNAWNCIVDSEQKKLICEKKGGTTPPAGGGGSWDCVTNKEGKKVCTKKDGTGGLPPGGSEWKCNKTSKNGTIYWICYGKTPAGGTPPGGGGWNCVKVKTEMGKDIWRCEKPDGKDDYPPGGGWYSCTKGTEWNGTKCEKVPTQPVPPTPTPTPGSKCAPGTKMWCDGLQYCGWGQVPCLASGKWKTKMVAGKEVLDCQELSNGARPNTVCACYHFFFNANCCERPDCIVPTGSKGQICPKSGGKLCDYCNPQKPECVENGAKCIVTNSHETFCGRLCSTTQGCPAGYKCTMVKLKVGTTYQCIPADYSCYY